MAKKGEKSTPLEAAAGQQNLTSWLQAHPERGAYRHGGYSENVKRRYSDGRYKQAKELNGIITRLTRDAGGDENLSEGQRIILGVIRSKFIVAKQISEYVATQQGIVDGKGEILPVLKSFCTFTECLRRNIEAFYSMANRKPSQIPDLQNYLKENYGEET